MEKVLILKTTDSKGVAAHGNFKWPESGLVECPDWSPEKICGNGLHGALWGEGDGSLFNWSEDAIWVVFEALASDVVDLGGKVKVPRGEVVLYGNQKDATDLIYKARNGAVIGGTATAGKYCTATAGDYGTATAGYCGTATAGDCGTATAGDCGTATAGNYGTIIIKYWDKTRYRVKTGYIGEGGLLPNVKYKLDDQNEFKIA